MTLRQCKINSRGRNFLLIETTQSAFVVIYAILTFMKWRNKCLIIMKLFIADKSQFMRCSKIDVAWVLRKRRENARLDMYAKRARGFISDVCWFHTLCGNLHKDNFNVQNFSCLTSQVLQFLRKWKCKRDTHVCNFSYCYVLSYLVVCYKQLSLIRKRLLNPIL